MSHTSAIECDGGPYCMAPEHANGCFALKYPKLIMQAELKVVERSFDVVVAQREALRRALEEIRDADPVDMALDPGWASRIAREALSS